MNSKQGTYAIAFKNDCTENAQIGRWNQIKIIPGYYIYIGSAFGKGGVRARVLRHFRRNKPNHWHIDYLRKYMNPVQVWYTNDSKHLEHKWALSLTKMKMMHAIKGFGCSDCSCFSHLFWCSDAPDFNKFKELVCNEIDIWSKNN